MITHRLIHSQYAHPPDHYSPYRTAGVVRNDNLREGIHDTSRALSHDACQGIERAYRFNISFLPGRPFGYLLIHYLKPHEIHIERHIGIVRQGNMEEDQVLMHINAL